MVYRRCGRCALRWEVRHEGAPQRGKGMTELPIAVRTVAVSHCAGERVLNFWQALGFRMDFELLRDGHSYTVLHAGVEIQASRRCGNHMTTQRFSVCESRSIQHSYASCVRVLLHSIARSFPTTLPN